MVSEPGSRIAQVHSERSIGMNHADPKQKWTADKAARTIARPTKDENGKAQITPEMLALAEALAHPEGDPYDNARKLGFYCEQCG